MKNYRLYEAVLLPYKFTLLSNKAVFVRAKTYVLLPYKFTLLSNKIATLNLIKMFYYPINLHYSQTSNLEKQHYSPCIYKVETIIIISHFLL